MYDYYFEIYLNSREKVDNFFLGWSALAVLGSDTSEMLGGD